MRTFLLGWQTSTEGVYYHLDKLELPVPTERDVKRAGSPTKETP